MRDPVLGNRLKDGARLDPAQAHVRPRIGADCPGEAPAVAVEHGQRPEIDRPMRHRPSDAVTQRIQIGAPVVIDHALGVARGAGGVIDRDRVPLVRGPAPVEAGVAAGEQRLVLDLPEQIAALLRRIVDVDDERGYRRLRERIRNHRREGPVGEQHPGIGVVEDEGERGGVEPVVEGVQNSAAHGHAVVRLQHRRRVGGHHRHGVALANAAPGQGRGQAPAARVELGVARAAAAVDPRRALGKHRCGTAQERERGQRNVVRIVAFQPRLPGALVAARPAHHDLPSVERRAILGAPPADCKRRILA